MLPKKWDEHCGYFLGKHRNVSPLLPPRTPWHKDSLFSTTTICFQDFSRKPAQEHESDRFPRLGYPAVCNYKMVGMCRFLCRDLEHPLALCGRTRLRGGCGWYPPPAGCLSLLSGHRGSRRRRSHENSKTTSESVLERKYLTILG